MAVERRPHGGPRRPVAFESIAGVTKNVEAMQA